MDIADGPSTSKQAGGAAVKLKRTEIAERLYRLTGEGIYRDTVMAARKPPIEQPLTNGGVAGMDVPQTTVYRGKVYWFFGDTSAIGYPLGNFASTGETYELPQRGGLDPSVGVNLLDSREVIRKLKADGWYKVARRFRIRNGISR